MMTAQALQVDQSNAFDVSVAIDDEAVIEFNGVSKSYGAITAIHQVSLKINYGQVIALVGPNGAGKSTLIEMLMGLRKPDSGTISVFGKDIIKKPKSHLVRLGVQLQETKVFVKLTGREYLEFFARIFPNPMDIEELITRLDMKEFIDKRLNSVSGGQKQRVALALSIINNPDIILLDEPTVGLDPLARKEFWRFIQRLKNDGKTLIFTTHYMDEAQALASHVIMLTKGKVVANGSPDEIIKKINSSKVITLDDAYEHLVEHAGDE
jgi:ABC-2 type transport system ATP-binding protein